MDDCIVTGPRVEVEKFLVEFKLQISLGDVARLYESGVEVVLLSLTIRKVDGGFETWGKQFD